VILGLSIDAKGMRVRQAHKTMTGTITHTRVQLIEGEAGERMTLDIDALLNGSDLEEELVSRTGNDDK